MYLAIGESVFQCWSQCNSMSC